MFEHPKHALTRTCFLPSLLALFFLGFSQQTNVSDLPAIVSSFKTDPRGPYQGIRWFCPDGRILPANERCMQLGGIQHALPKDIVEQIEEAHGIYLGQILAGTRFEDFLDAGDQYSRLKQYQMERFLQAVDDGWIMRRARFYRGALQAEDEERWAKEFLVWLVAEDEMLRTQYFLTRQIAKGLPRNDSEDRATQVRALASSISESFPKFMDIRVKIHGQPDPTDVDRVKEFRRRYQGSLPPDIDERLEILATELAGFYRAAGPSSLERYLSRFPAHTPIGYQLRRIAEMNRGTPKAASQYQIKELAHLVWIIRKDITTVGDAEARLSLIDLSVDSEAILFRLMSSWRPSTIRGLLEKDYVLAKAAAGCGYIEIWEWEFLEPFLFPPAGEGSVSLEAFLSRVEFSLRTVEWGTATVRSVFEGVAELFSAFEPRAQGLIDDRTRASILLGLGEVAAQLSDVASQLAGSSNAVLDIPGQNQIRGLNPGVAVGELEVVTGSPDGIEIDPGKIYLLLRAPADLKPVAGIATVSEGNAVSHVQLLARNLGIPNAVISRDNLTGLAAYSGSRVFYAVSPRGRVVIKHASEMSPEEKALVESWSEEQHGIVIPTGEVDLNLDELVSLRSLRASDSGKICGPKAANLGQLSALFPDKVPSGLVIPFGVFRQHMDQPMPGTSSTYWEFMRDLFSEPTVDGQIANGGGGQRRSQERLSRLRQAIESMSFLPGFEDRLRQRFAEVFAAEIGTLPIFIRSDTNMEDLRGFTGAGLNLTVGNVREEAEILTAIRRVWASPFTERSYRWRQSVLRNPENVFPSVLLIPSVNVDKSGVMITTGLSSSNGEDVTVAFNWGGFGAVEGQAAETYLLRSDGKDILLSPAREPEYNYFLLEGGMGKAFVTFDTPILSRSERFQLRQMATQLRQTLPSTPGIQSEGPFDVELGFWNQSLWLFQVRPFVENKKARSSAYLAAMDEGLTAGSRVSLDRPIRSQQLLQ